MIINNNEIAAWDSKYRLKFINSISGYKSVHLIGTKGQKDDLTNLSIINSVVHISSEPPRIGFIMRPLTVKRDTYKNIIETKSYTINHVQSHFIDKAHYTSANLPRNQSEFERCNLKEEYDPNFKAPFVTESSIKLAMKLVEDIEIDSSGGRLIVGEVQFIKIEKGFIEEDGQLDLEKSNDVCVTGLNQYSSVKKIKKLPYARAEEIPKFNIKERPDNVVFDPKNQTYNASILPYGTNVGAPSISTTNVSSWKAQGINNFNHVLKNKIDQVKNEYQKLTQEYQVNELLYSAKYEFEPIIGAVYHLYSKENSVENFLSLIPPESWTKKHIGSFKLQSDKVWIQLNKNVN